MKDREPASSVISKWAAANNKYMDESRISGNNTAFTNSPSIRVDAVKVSTATITRATMAPPKMNSVASPL